LEDIFSDLLFGESIKRSLENPGFRAPKSIPQWFEACNTCHFQTHLQPRRIEIKFGKLDGSRGDAISDLEVIYRILVICLMPGNSDGDPFGMVK